MQGQFLKGRGLLTFRSILTSLILIFVYITQIHGDDEEEPDKVFACYWTSRSHYREGDGRFTVDDVDPFLCTHIIYGFATINNQTYLTESPHPALDHGPNDNPVGVEDMYRSTVALKSKNMALKVLIGVGGRNLGKKVFSDMAASAGNRKLFIDSAVQIVRTFEFDGIDLDWEYPEEADKADFVKLVKELRSALDAAIPTPRALLTAALGAETETINAYDFPNIYEHLDFMSIMAYDYNMYSDENKEIEHHSPLYYGDAESVNKTIEHILKVGKDNNIEKFAEKLILGVGAYGRTYTLNSRSEHSIGTIAKGLGDKYSFSQEAGIIYYFEVCLNLVGKTDWDFEYEDNLKIPYTFNDTQWIGYDDEYSIAGKVDIANDNNLRGIMIYSLEMDDFRGRCGSWWNSPLANAVKNRMQYNLNQANQQKIIQVNVN